MNRSESVPGSSADQAGRLVFWAVRVPHIPPTHPIRDSSEIPCRPRSSRVGSPDEDAHQRLPGREHQQEGTP